MSDVEELAALAIDCGYRIRSDLGPGLLESVYETASGAFDELGGGTFREGPRRVINDRTKQRECGGNHCVQ